MTHYHSAVTAQNNSKVFWSVFGLTGFKVDQITHKIRKKCLKLKKRLIQRTFSGVLGLIAKTLYSEINYKTLQEYIKMHIIKKFLEGL